MSVDDFRKALRAGRIARDLSEEDAAKAAGVSVHTWRSYERRGGRVPPLHRLKAITRAVGPGPTNALLKGSGYVCGSTKDEAELKLVAVSEWLARISELASDAKRLIDE